MDAAGTGQLPTFFVIGAAKCGTTSLHHYLDEHPEISMSKVKEPQIFAEDGYRSRLGEYRSLFAREAAVRGESSAVYSQYPRWPGVPERIATSVPEARFVYLVGDPIERAISHYRQHVADGKESRTLSAALADWAREDSLFLCPSRYATQLRRYLEHFDADRVLVVDQRDLLEDRELTLSRVFGFLAVEPSFRSPGFEAKLNPTDLRRVPTALGRRLEETRVLRAARGVPMPAALRRGVRGLVSRRVRRPELERPLRARVAESLREEVEWLRAFTGQDFATWSL